MGRERARQACLEQSAVTVGRGRYLSGRGYSSTRPQDSVRGIDIDIPATLSLGERVSTASSASVLTGLVGWIPARARSRMLSPCGAYSVPVAIRSRSSTTRSSALPNAELVSVR